MIPVLGYHSGDPVAMSSSEPHWCADIEEDPSETVWQIPLSGDVLGHDVMPGLGRVSIRQDVNIILYYNLLTSDYLPPEDGYYYMYFIRCPP